MLFHFSRRYLACNPATEGPVFASQDAVHTLTCAIMLLNTDLHGQSLLRKMTCHDFTENLSGLNEGADFPPNLLKAVYASIKETAIPWSGEELVLGNPEQHPHHLRAQQEQGGSSIDSVWPEKGPNFSPKTSDAIEHVSCNFISCILVERLVLVSHKNFSVKAKREWLLSPKIDGKRLCCFGMKGS